MGEVKMVKPKEDALVIRHNKLIESHLDLSMQEKRIFLWLISEIDKSDEEFKAYRVNVKELAEFVGVDRNKNFYKQITGVVEKLRQRTIYIKELDSDNYTVLGLISAAKYFVGQGFVELEISRYLRPYLLQLKNNFTPIYLKYALALKSTYSIRVYELLKQYEKIGTRLITVEELRNMVGITEGQYTLYADFKRRVLEASEKEINLKTDIEMIYEEIKEGKKTVAIKFHIRQNQGQQPTGENLSNSEYDELYERIVNHGIKPLIAKQMMDNFYYSDPERITWSIQEVERQAKQGKIKVTGAWLTKAIQEDYRPQRNLFSEKLKEEKQEQEKTKLSAVVIENIISKLEEQKTSLDKKYSAYKKEKMVDYVLSLNNEKRLDIEDKIKPNLSFGLQSFVNATDLRKKWSDTFVSLELQKVISEQNIILFDNEETWCANNKLENTKELDKKILDFKNQIKGVKL